MYDKKKTIKGYMGGGYMKPMSYANGGYIPGLSSLLYGARLNRDKEIAMKEFEANAEKVAKEQKYRGLLGKIGSFAGTALGAALAAPTGGMSVLAGKALGSAIGKGAGELVGGSFVDTENLKKSSTGLYKDDFEFLRKQGREAQDLGGLAERSAIAGATTYGLGKAGEVADFGKKAYAEKFGMDALENLGMAGETDPLLSSLTKDVSTAQAGAESIIGDREKLLQDIFEVGGADESLFDSKELFDTQDRFLDSEIKRLFGSEAPQVENAQLGFNLTESAEMYNDGGYVQGYEDGGMTIRRANNSGVLKGDYLDYVGDTNYDLSPRYDRYGNYYPNPVIEASQKDGGIKEKLDNIYYPEFLSPDSKQAFDLFMSAKNLSADEKALREKHYGMFDEISERLTGTQRESARQLSAYDKGVRDKDMSMQYLNESDIKNAEDLMSKIISSKSFKDYFKESRKNRKSSRGEIEEYRHGGLIDMNPFSRRIL